MSATYRYPFPPYPEGWYLVVESAAVPVNEVVRAHYFGRELVAFRTASGRAVVADAHCPHMGAHLGYGGVVDGEGIRCPFHHWHYDCDGRCDDVPYSTSSRPPNVGINTWLVREQDGLILVWFSPAGRAPVWDPPTRSEFGEPGWVGYETVGWTIRMHTQELAENIPDMAHFTYVHTVGDELRADFDIDGPVYRQRSLMRNGDHWVEFTRQEATGLGLVWLSTQSMWFLTATTPIDEERVELRLLFLARDDDGTGTISPATRAAIDATAANTARDVPIWEHKVYVEKAPLIADDGPIRELRRWARQFYPSSALEPTSGS
jgi:phenylpropionate dioxygenase-like ring-hydroxylating dioxygenase large terminal subunit